MLYQLSKKLVRRGHEVTIYTSDYQLSREYIDSIPEVKIHPFKTWLIWARFAVTLGIIRNAREQVKDFDIIHLHDYRTFQNIVVYHYAKKYNVPYVLQPHGTTPRVMERKWLKWLFDFTFGYRILRDASKVVAVSKEEAGYDKQMGAGDKKVSIIYNGMDVESFRNLPEYGKFRGVYGIEGTMILYLGRINKTKGIDFLAKAFSELTKEVDRATLVIAGPDDGYKAELEKIIEALNLGNKIKFVGYVDEKDKLSPYVDADLFVNAVAYMGGVALTPLEAIMCNTPVIATEECGEVIKEADCGYFVEYGDIEDLKLKMKRALGNPEEGKMMVERGKKYIYENLTWNRVAQEVEGIYHQVLELKRSSS